MLKKQPAQLPVTHSLVNLVMTGSNRTSPVSEKISERTLQILNRDYLTACGLRWRGGRIPAGPPPAMQQRAEIATFLLKDAGAMQKGQPYYMGNRALRDADYRSPSDTILGARFRSAGFITLGKTTRRSLARNAQHSRWPSVLPAIHGTWSDRPVVHQAALARQWARAWCPSRMGMIRAARSSCPQDGADWLD